MTITITTCGADLKRRARIRAFGQGPAHGDGRADTVKRQMRLVLVGHGESDWTVAGRYTGTTVEPLVAEYDYGDYEGVTAEQISHKAPGWDIWRDGCPGGELISDVGRRPDAFLHAYTEDGTQPVVVSTHGHLSRILAARALGLATECGRLSASATAALSLLEDHHRERCVGLWNANAALLADTTDPAAHPGQSRPDPPVPVAGLLP